MNAITQAILNQSILEVSLIKITNATKDSFLMTIESRVTNTGPFSATQSPMTVDMVGPTGIFGRLDLPEVKTKSGGTDILIPDQEIKIVSMTNYKAFVKSLMQDEELVMKLENGKGTIKAMMMTANIVYQKDVKMKGMNGPKTVMVKTEKEGDGFKNTMLTINPSPLEIDMGTVHYEIRNEDGVKIADQSGKTYITRGESTSTMVGKTTGEAPKVQAKLVGVAVDDENWHKETIGYLDTTTTLSEEFVAMCTH
ncbi:hypothetical protein N431DRAFT_375921 [Stipitochalara longipes BDJ]|nr:hypothetical protein N431DRAFT_375921 [Stipitochalara longipes BDJ]